MQLLTFLVEQDVLYQENTNSNPPHHQLRGGGDH